jgi:hypothetical protein
MTPYSSTVKLKLGLIVAAVIIALASLWYSNQLANRIHDRELDYVRLWTSALEYQYESQATSINPYQELFVQLEQAVRDGKLADSGLERQQLIQALRWARSMPPPGETIFVSNEIVIPNRFEVPTIVTDTTGDQIVSFRNTRLDTVVTAADSAEIRSIAADLDKEYRPLRINLAIGPYRLAQVVHYGESSLVKQLRYFPTVQLFFFALFVFVGYMGFSHVRRNEQSNLWVGMAKEAAHQLGTPISSMLGWIEMLRLKGGETSQRVATELERDVQRLERVASRFSKIGSRPVLDVTKVGPVVQSVCDYMGRRISADAGPKLVVDVPDELVAPLNVELFEWVVENLLKNSLDAIEEDGGMIEVTGRTDGRSVVVDIKDNGKGIELVNSKNIFRPGYSTKKRGWGLGLSLAKRIIEDYHGGVLSLASSKPGEGTTFRIRLPLGD